MLVANDVKNIAYLARLAIDEDDISAYTHNLSQILGFVEQMNSADTAGISPMAHPLEVSQRLRPDEVSEENERERYQSIAPATEKGLYLVPQVIE